MKNEFYMKECISLANKSVLNGEVPIGAIILQNDKIISKAHNTSIHSNDPTAHAEINVIRDVCKKINNYRINDAILYVTLEPCLMCISAICEARIDSVVFGAYTSNEINFHKNFNSLKTNFNINHTPKFIGGILEAECSALIKNFFKTKRG